MGGDGLSPFAWGCHLRTPWRLGTGGQTPFSSCVTPYPPDQQVSPPLPLTVALNLVGVQQDELLTWIRAGNSGSIPHWKGCGRWGTGREGVCGDAGAGPLPHL